MLLNCKQCSKNVNNWFIHLYCLCIVSIDFHDSVNDLKVSANESIFFPFVRQMTHKNAQKRDGMLLKPTESIHQPLNP